VGPGAGGGSGRAQSPDLAPPGMPQLPFGRPAAVSREVETGLSQAYMEAAMEVDDEDHHRQSPSWSRSGGAASQADAMFSALDRNHDGVITRAEMREAYRAGRKY